MESCEERKEGREDGREERKGGPTDGQREDKAVIRGNREGNHVLHCRVVAGVHTPPFLG